MNTAKIKIDSNRIGNLSVASTEQKASTNYSYITYAIVKFPFKNKISAREYEKKNNIKIPLFYKGYDQYKKDAELFKFGKDIYATFLYRKVKRAVKLQASKHHNQLYFNASQL